MPPKPTTKPLTNLRKLRLARGMTHLQLASQADIAINTVQKLERSEDPQELGRVEVWTWQKLSRALGVKVKEIYPSLPL